jgi:Family of unknown function (DUF5681)
MPFEKGQIANPAGAGSTGRGKPFTDALMRALLQEDGKKLRAIAEKLIEQAMNGDVSALREIADRVEGRSKQSVEVADNGVTIIMAPRRNLTNATTDPRVIDFPTKREAD